MSWNNASETKRFEEEQNELISFYRRHGMSKKHIKAIKGYDKRKLNDRRKQLEHGSEEPLYTIDQNGNEIFIKSDALIHMDEIFDNPFQHGFDNPVLTRLWKTGDDLDRRILYLLYYGYNQADIEAILRVHHNTINSRIIKMRAVCKKNL